MQREMTFPEIAEALGLTDRQVILAYCRGIEKLRKNPRAKRLFLAAKTEHADGVTLHLKVRTRPVSDWIAM